MNPGAISPPHVDSVIPTPRGAGHSEAVPAERESGTRRRGEYDHLEPLFRRLKDFDEDDPRRHALRERLISAHTPVAEHVARLYRNRGEPIHDLVQVAVIGLINAVDRYEPQYGRGFLPYAIPTIRGEVQRHFRDATWALRVPRRLKELRHAISVAAERLSERLGRSPRPSELADYLGLSIATVREGLAASAAYRTDSLNRPVGLDDATVDYGELIGAWGGHFDAAEDGALLRTAIRSLPEREQRIVALRFFHDMTQSQIARAVGISQMHVSRLLANSLEQLRTCLSENRRPAATEPR